MSARGFTLIEMLIALTVGTVVLGVAFAGFRVSAQAVSTANRLSLENAMLREGYLIANEQLDSWTWHDDPEAPRARRPLTRVAADGRGLAFTPLAETPWRRVAATERERDVGWDPGNSWAPADPACWWRGDMGEKADGAMRHGRYAIFAHADAAAGPVAISSPQGAYGAVDVRHAWLYGQTRGLIDSLGFYGGCEYLGGNVVYGWYGRQDGGTTDGGIPRWLVRPTGDPASFTNDDGAVATVRGLYRLTFVTQFALPPGDPSTAVDALLAADRRWWPIYAPGHFDAWKTGTGAKPAPMAAIPAHWPGLSVSINRAIKNRRFVAMSFVRIASPLTGQVVEFSFSGFGTTLRGARQQRHRDGGWARWDNAPGAANDPTLDAM